MLADKKAKRTAQIMEWRKNNPDKVREAKRRYYSSEKGKAMKRKEEAAYKASGGRAAAEKRRSERGLSEARKEVKLKYQLMRRANEKTLDEFDSFVLREAVRLCKSREAVFNFPWHVDHIIPVSQGGSSAHSNIQVVPASWNRTKSNKHSQRFFAG